MIDLHTHSTASDGTDTPAKLVEKALDRKLEALALTDHDTIAGLDEAEETARGKNIHFVRGCEISTSTDLGEMHILGLWIPDECDILDNFLTHLREQRQSRNEKMLARLRALGFDIHMSELKYIAKHSIGRPHMATALMAKGYVESTDEAFAKYLGENGKAYVPKVAPTPAQAARILSGLGATVAIAHPLLRPLPREWLENTVENLAKNGLGALEVWHTSQNENETGYLSRLAKKFGLGLTGGSDYHGENKPGIGLGTGTGSLDIPLQVYENLLARRKASGLPC